MTRQTKRFTCGLLLLLAVGCTHLGVTKDAQGEARPDHLIATAAAGLHGMAWSAGQLLIADSYGNLHRGGPRGLHAFDGETGEWLDLGLYGSVPSGMETAGGMLYVCDTGTDTVSVFNADLEFVSFLSAPAPWNVALGPNGTVYAVSAHGAVYELRSDAPARQLFAGLDAPFDIVVTDSGDFWVSEQGVEGEGRVTLRNPRGRVLRTFGGLDNPEGLVLDRQGDLWIADTGAGKIYKIVDDALVLMMDDITLPIVGVEAEDGEIWFNGAISGVYGIYRVHPQPDEEAVTEEREAS